MGGLGNQLFQIATTLAYSWTHSIPAVFHKIHHSPSIFKPKPVYWDSYFHTLSTQPTPLDDAWVYQEPRFEYDALPKTKTDMLLRGYFQSYRYFDSYRSEILKLFQLPKSTINTIHQQYEPENWDAPIAVHIRRGDYLKLKKNTPFFQKAIIIKKHWNSFQTMPILLFFQMILIGANERSKPSQPHVHTGIFAIIVTDIINTDAFTLLNQRISTSCI